jgi:glycosyltransferase involved in cell wall biosynthesis
LSTQRPREPDITVVVPTFNRRSLLEETVASVLRQTARSWELIVVDDASTDDTPRWLGSLNDPNVRWYRQETNRGESAARNLGLRESRAPFVLFLDDDDLLRPAALERLHRRLLRRPDVIGVVGAVMGFDSSGARRKITHTYRSIESEVWPEVLLGWRPLTGASLLRKEVVVGGGGFDEEIRAAEDEEMWLRLGTMGRVGLYPGIVADKRAHAGQISFADRAEVARGFRLRFIQSLPEPHASRAQRLIETKRAWRRAESAYAAGDFRGALRGFLTVAAPTRGVWRFPIPRAYLVKDITKSLVTAAFQLLLGQRLTGRARAMWHLISSGAIKRHPKAERKTWTR